MGEPERKAREIIGSSSSSSSYFLRCFGISRKIHSDKPIDGHEKKKKKKTKTRSRRWFSRGTQICLKNGEITPAPIYETTEKQKSTVEDDKQSLIRVIRHVTDRKNIAGNCYKSVDHETKEINTNEQRDINPDLWSFLGYDTCHEHASTTFRGGKLNPDETVGSGSKPKELKEKKSSRVKKGSRVDPVIGISIIMLTLMIMLTWGRLCAILCTATWCYFLPRLKETTIAAKRKRCGGGKTDDGSFPDYLDLNSEAYKKKVVLEGFLLRQHHV